MRKPFRFKQFSIFQDRCGMKISSVACILGAMAAKNFQGREKGIGLDIGTGTGLLALMLAQVWEDSEIIAVEKEINAFEQASENFLQSPWADKIRAIHDDILTWSATQSTTFDIIICNPPFFHQQLFSPNQQRNSARHNENLRPECLASIIQRLLQSTGEFWLLIANDTCDVYLNAFTAKGLFPFFHASIFHSPQHSTAFCAIIAFSFIKKEISPSDFMMRAIDENYSLEFQTLLKEYLIIF